MGLPRYLKDKLLCVEYSGEHKYRVDFINLCVETGRARPDKSVTLKTDKSKIYMDDIYGIGECMSMRHYGSCENATNYGLFKIFKLQSFKYLHGYDYDRNKYMNRYEAQFEKKLLNYFLYWQKINGQWTQVVKELYVNSYYRDKAQSIQDGRAESEFRLILQKEEIEKIRNIEQGRTFSGRLRHLILERDNFKCVLCGRGVPEGAVLEVDHIQEWEDGGKTTYDNGQTVCSDCNKGKHHAKKFNNKVAEFKKAVSE